MGRILLDAPSSVEHERTVNAVRSSPLSPQQRYKQDMRGYRKVYQDSLYSSAEDKRKAALKESDGRDRRNKDAQLGNPLHSTVIITRLRKLNPNLIFEVARADSSKTGIYIRNELIIPEKRQYLFCFESAMSPEFMTIIKADEDGETQGIMQGWRTILARLIKLKLITAHGSWVLFGPPSRGSKNWQEMKVS